MSRIKFQKMTKDREDSTKIIAGKEEVAVSELEKKDSSSEVKKKLDQIENELEHY